jgi:plasmid maintenance system killer protein
MLFKKIIALYSENKKNPINTLCEQTVELLNVKEGGTYSYHCNYTYHMPEE